MQVTLPAEVITPFAVTPPPPTAAPVLLDTFGPRNFAANINPFTGLPTDPAALNRRPLLVKISNAPVIVRPQAGIGMADVVFEHITEGGLTRFSALFYSQTPQRIGSIRSGRLIDLELVPMLNSLFGYAGASDGVLGRIIASDVYSLTYSSVDYGRMYSRDGSIDPPHNLFLDPAALWETATAEGLNARPELTGFAFRNEPPPGGEDGALLDFSYPLERVTWQYDVASGVYLRASDNLPHTDALTGEQVRAANVVLLYAAHTETDIVESVWQGQASYSIDITLQGEGDAVLYRDGYRYPARWVRSSLNEMMTFFLPDGTQLPFKPGVTWVQVLPLDE